MKKEIEMQISELKDKFKQCLDSILKRDFYLIENDLNERTFCHRLALYLEQEIKDFHVDCEYNRNMNKPKAIHLFAEKYKSEMNNDEDLKKRDDADKMQSKLRNYVTYPDIIVHQRGSNDKNLLVIEVKKVQFIAVGLQVDKKDNDKLCAYTSKVDTNDYHYRLGVWLAYQPGKQNKSFFLNYFQNGNCVGYEWYPALEQSKE